MKFRYFILSGPSLEAYLASEAKEMEQRAFQHKTLLTSFDIESYRPNHNGGVASLIFKEGKQPEGMVRAHKNLDKKEVFPHAKLAVAAPIRELLKTVQVTENSQGNICSLLKLPMCVCGPHHISRSGMAMYHSRAGHVGPNVVIEVPAKDESGDPEAKKPFGGHPDLKEIEVWEYLKLHADFKDFKDYTGFFLPAREA
jgi:hypothetical protein